jgi:catalase
MPSVTYSKALSQENTAKNSINTRKIAALVMDGFNDEELTAVKDALDEEGAHLEVISQYLSPIKGASGKLWMPDHNFVSSSSVLYDAIYVPGGKESIDSLAHQTYILEFLNEAYKHCKPIAASSEGIALLGQTSIEEKLADAADVVSDTGVVTSMAKPTGNFNAAFIKAIMAHRHWMRERNERSPIDMQVWGAISEEDLTVENR